MIGTHRSALIFGRKASWRTRTMAGTERFEFSNHEHLSKFLRLIAIFTNITFIFTHLWNKHNDLEFMDVFIDSYHAPFLESSSRIDTCWTWWDWIWRSSQKSNSKISRWSHLQIKRVKCEMRDIFCCTSLIFSCVIDRHSGARAISLQQSGKLFFWSVLLISHFQDDPYHV